MTVVRLLDDYSELRAGRAERLLHSVAGVAFGEDEAEVAVPVGQGLDALAGRDGDRGAGDARRGCGLVMAFDGPEDAGTRYGDHEDPGWPGGAGAGGGAAEGVGQHQFLQAR